MLKKTLNNKSVLVVGWEYPPRVEGGLAIATYGIVEALRHFIHVKLVIPYKDENTPELENVTVYGLNSVEIDFSYEEQMEILNKVVYKKINQGINFEKYWQNHEDDVSAYPAIPLVHESIKERLTEEESTEEQITKEQISRPTTTIRNHLEKFQSDEVYGWGLWERLAVFEQSVAALALQLDFDIIHCHDWLTFQAGKRIKIDSRKPLVLHVHALETDRIDERIKNEIYYLEQSAMEIADSVIPVSFYTKEKIIKNYGIDPKKINPVYNAIDTKLVKRWKHKIPQKIIAFVGRVTTQKGINCLYETAKKVIAKRKDVRFVIAGKGELLEELINISADNQLSKYFIFTGFLSRAQIDSLLAASDVYFMPSLSEPFGLSALEATRAGVPCVISKQSGVAEILTSALKADFWDTDLFAKHITDILVNEKLQEKMIRNSRNDISKISWLTSAQKIATTYSQLLN